MSEAPTFSLPMPSTAPPCFTAEQWMDWRTPHNSVRMVAKNYCEDCTPDYQAEMLATGRCIHPETIFIRDADGFISGHRIPQPRTQEPNT